MKKRILTLMAAALAVMSCSPQAYRLLCDTQYPGLAGLTLGGKTMAIVYLATGSETDSLAVSISDGLAQGLEATYFDSRKEVPVYRIEKDPAGDYSSRDSLVNYLVDVNSDVLFILDAPRLAQEADSLICYSDLYAYDSMKRRNEGVVRLTSRDPLTQGALLHSDAQYVGYKYASYFAKDLRKEYFSIIYYDDMDPEWVEAVYECLEGRWEAAMEIWMTLLETKRDEQKLACAAYDMALGCYMVEEYELALEWIERSESYCPLSLTAGLKSRIEAAL